jgi:hypothetical protein
VTPNRGKQSDTITLRAEYGFGTSGLSIKTGGIASTLVTGYTDTLARFILPAGVTTGSTKVLATNTNSDTCSINFIYTAGGSIAKKYFFFFKGGK